MSSDEPIEVQRLYAALKSLPDLYGPDSNVSSIWGVDDSVLSSLDFATFPHALIRWAGGGQKGQALAQFGFRIKPTARGWRTLEFLAWWIRDLARSGHHVQLRPFGLPPEIGGTVQLGETLSFNIDIPYRVEGDDLSPLLAFVDHMAGYLEDCVEEYARALSAS